MTPCTHEDLNLECAHCWEYPPGSLARACLDVQVATADLVEALPLPVRVVARVWHRLCFPFR